MTKRLIWFKGQCVPSDQAMVNALSPTAQFGLNVFEGIRGYWCSATEQIYIFRLYDHLARLHQSCKLLSLDMPYSIEKTEGFIRDVILQNGYREDIALRMTVFMDDEGTWNTVRPADMFIAPIAARRKSAETLKGLSATVSSWRRIDDLSMPPRIKCGAN